MFADFIHPKTFDSSQRQYFSFPSTLIYYISKNPFSTEGLLKFQKTCKYFFAKNKIAVIDRDDISWTKSNFAIYGGNFSRGISRFKEDTKFWLANELCISARLNGNLYLPKNIYRCNLRILKVSNRNVTMNQFNFLTAGENITKLCLKNVNIKDDEDALVPLDKILAKVPNLANLDYSCEDQIFTNQTFKNLNSLVFKSFLECFELSIHNLEENADISLLKIFVKHNLVTWPFMYKTNYIFNFKMNNGQLFRDQLRFIFRNDADRGWFKPSKIYVN